jgi:hypothetical protein
VRRTCPRFQLRLAAAACCGLWLFLAPSAQARVVFDASSDAATISDIPTAAVVQPNLPAWLQVAPASAPLYADDSGSATLTRLPRYAYLRVLGRGSARLRVQAYDDSGNPAQAGWVYADHVLPSAPGIDWLVASQATTLWSSADSNGRGLRNVGRFTALQKIDDQGLGRTHVRVYSSDFNAVVDQGWVETLDTGPALPPQVRVPAPSDGGVGLRSVNSTGQQQAFLDLAAQAARQAAALFGVPASVTVAQAILESSWGQSTLAVEANNYFGVKAMGSLGDNGVVWMATSEFDDSGQLYETMSAFKAYTSLADSMVDHDVLLTTAPRYTAAMRSAGDPRQFAALIAQAGYSTDPAYADKLIALMDRYNLYQLDS